MVREWLIALVVVILNLFKTSDIVDSGVKKVIIETPTIVVTTTPTKKSDNRVVIVTPTQKILKTGDTEPWGVSKQLDEHTWTMKIGMDSKMATPEEIWKAVNVYRQSKGKQQLAWDSKLAELAQSRAKYLNSIKSTDGHKGFEEFLKDESGYEKLGFNWLGENISFGYKLEGVHLIEWMYAGDKPHDDNQLDSKWDHVGIGVDGLATCLIFATAKR